MFFPLYYMIELYDYSTQNLQAELGKVSGFWGSGITFHLFVWSSVLVT